MQDDTAEQNSAFTFHGSWREFAPIAFTNLLLTIVTLGFYRFWATTRERRYLWGSSRFIDEDLEWTGTGKELLVGFLMVLVLLGLPFLILQFATQALAMQGHGTAAFFLTIGLFTLIVFLVGVARFRALRYRLNRTYWHGIRGGSDDQGFAYGLSYLWKSAAGYLSAGLLIPWSMTSLWNERWGAMSFGSHPFRCDAEFSPLMWRFILFYIAPFIMIVGAIIMGAAAALSGAFDTSTFQDPANLAVVGMAAGLIILAVYLVLPLIWLFYYSAFFRLVLGKLRLHGLEFAFTARTRDWLLLFMGDVALVIVTLGIGWIFLGYRHWKFFITHMEAYGEVDLSQLTQSTTAVSRHGEGLLDAFDVGAI